MLSIPRLVFLSICFLIGPQTAFAQDLNFTNGEPQPQDLLLLEKCVDFSDRNDGDLEDCIAVAAAPCQDEPGGYSTAGMIDCFGRELGFWDIMLNVNYRVLRTNLNEETADRLAEVQKAWLKFRDGSCGLNYDIFDGTMAGPVYIACINRTTAERAIQLRYNVDALLGSNAKEARDDVRFGGRGAVSDS